MGIPVMVLGESGSGKSSSLRNFQRGEVFIINVAKKPLPFRSNLHHADTDNYSQIDSCLKRSLIKTIVIDDCQYLMANEFMRSAKVSGYQKFTDIGLNFWMLVQTVINQLPEDCIVYFMGHIERDANGHEKFKTIGKMLDEKITIEGMFTIVLKTCVRDGEYLFSTRTNGQDTVKTPIGMFETEYISNDLKLADCRIREYYQLEQKEEQP